MAFETRAVLHVDGKTTVKAKGLVVGGEFVGEYKFQGMTYGVTEPNFKTEKVRLDSLKVGDKVLVNGDEIRDVTFIRNGMMGINWHSIYLSTPIGKTGGHLIGHEHDLCERLIDDLNN